MSNQNAQFKPIQAMNTKVTFKIAEENLGMFCSETFSSQAEAQQFIDTQLKSRSKNDGNDDYWRGLNYKIVKTTITQEYLN